MPETPVAYEDVELIDADGLGFTCRIGTEQVFIGKYVPLDGTTIHAKGDYGRLLLPRWFVEQQRLPLDSHLSDRDVEEWFARASLQAAAAQEYAEAHLGDAAAQAALDRATAELTSAMVLHARRQREP